MKARVVVDILFPLDAEPEVSSTIPVSVRFSDYSGLVGLGRLARFMVRLNRALTRTKARSSRLFPRSVCRGGFLPGQLLVERLFFFRYVLLVAFGIYEGIGAALFHAGVLFFEAKVFAVGSQENIAGKGFQDLPHALVIFGYVWIVRVVD